MADLDNLGHTMTPMGIEQIVPDSQNRFGGVHRSSGVVNVDPIDGVIRVVVLHMDMAV